MEENKSTKTALGLNENVEALLCYVLGWVTGLVFLLLEKENKFVRFHALQSLITFLGLFVFSIVVRMMFYSMWIIPFGWMALSLIWLLSVILWIVLMIKAYQGEKFKVPVVGDFAEQQIYK